jgi:hypothetical protein
MKKHFVWLFLFITPLLANDPVVDLEVARKEIQAQTIEIVGTAMNLDPAVESAFWAIYKDYEVERTRLGDVKVALLNQFMAIAEDMTDEQAQMVAQHHFAMQRDIIALSEKYYGIMAEELSPVLAARFVQVMNQIDTVIDANLSREMAIIGGF